MKVGIKLIVEKMIFFLVKWWELKGNDWNWCYLRMVFFEFLFYKYWGIDFVYVFFWVKCYLKWIF